MTKPRLEIERQLFGIVGKPVPGERTQAQWNKLWAKLGHNAWMGKYPTTKETLPERLSEMYHFDRRGYVVGRELQEAIVPLLDELHETAQQQQRVNTVFNHGGRLIGFVYTDDEREALWKKALP